MSFTRVSFFTSLLLILSSIPAMAFDIWPLNPQLVLKPNSARGSNQADAALLFFDNGKISNTRFQVRVFRWSQTNNQDVYQEQSDVQPQPPIIDFTSSGKQVIRLINNNHYNSSNIERSYRLIIDEIPSSQSRSKIGLNFRMRIVVPFFVYPANINEEYIDGVSGVPKKVSPASWNIIQQNGKRFLEIKNLGNVHLRLADVYFSRKGLRSATYKVSQGLLGYVLAGQSMQFELKNWQFGSGQGLVLYSTYAKGQEKVIGNE